MRKWLTAGFHKIVIACLLIATYPPLHWQYVFDQKFNAFLVFLVFIIVIVALLDLPFAFKAFMSAMIPVFSAGLFVVLSLNAHNEYAFIGIIIAGILMLYIGYLVLVSYLSKIRHVALSCLLLLVIIPGFYNEWGILKASQAFATRGIMTKDTEAILQEINAPVTRVDPNAIFQKCLAANALGSGSEDHISADLHVSQCGKMLALSTGDAHWCDHVSASLDPFAYCYTAHAIRYLSLEENIALCESSALGKDRCLIATVVGRKDISDADAQQICTQTSSAEGKEECLREWGFRVKRGSAMDFTN